MATSKKVLVLGNSTGGGEWPPLAAVALGLSQRGHSIRYVADSTSATALQHTGLVVDVVHPEAELMPYFIRWGERVAASGLSAEGHLPITAPFTEWSADCFPMVCDLVSQFQPDFILSQLFAIELASRLKTEAGLPWCFVNPGCYFGPQSVRPLEADFTPPNVPLLVHFRSLLEGADLVLHGTDPVLDPPPAELPPHHYYVGPLLWEPTTECPLYLDEPGAPWVLVTLSSVPQEGETVLARSALRALSGYPVRVLLTVSGGHSLNEIGPLPANARVESFVPHSQVLQRACLSISHAGHGIVSKSLYYGVPMVLVPWDRDQPGVAFRAGQVGTAEVVAREALTEERLTEAIAKVLETPSYRQEAGRFAERLQAQDAVGTACDLIEECLDAAV